MTERELIMKLKAKIDSLNGKVKSLESQLESVGVHPGKYLSYLEISRQIAHQVSFFTVTKGGSMVLYYVFFFLSLQQELII
jgi:hypothetical protein